MSKSHHNVIKTIFRQQTKLDSFIIVLEIVNVTMKNHLALLFFLKTIVGQFGPPLFHVLSFLNVFGILPALREVAVSEDEDARLVVHLPAAARSCAKNILVREQFFNPLPHWGRLYWPITSLNANCSKSAEGKVKYKFRYFSSCHLGLL